MYATLKLHQKCGTDVWTDNWQYLQIGLANIVLFFINFILHSLDTLGFHTIRTVDGHNDDDVSFSCLVDLR